MHKPRGNVFDQLDDEEDRDVGLQELAVQPPRKAGRKATSKKGHAPALEVVEAQPSVRSAQSVFDQLPDAPGNVIDIAEAIKTSGRRTLLRITEVGKERLLLRVPTGYGAATKDAELTFLLDFPGLCEPFSEALATLANVSDNAFTSVHGNVRTLEEGFCRYLRSNARTGLNLSQITTLEVNGFIHWLDTVEYAKGKGYARNSRERFLSVFRQIIHYLQLTPGWREKLPATLEAPWSPWSGEPRGAPRSGVPMEDYRDVYLACVEEVGETMRKVRHMRALLAKAEAQGSPFISILPEGCRTGPEGMPSNPYHQNLGLLLAALRHRYRDNLVFPNYAEMDPRLHRAIRSHGGIEEVYLCFFPNCRALVPFALLLAIHLNYNKETLFASRVGDYSIRRNLLNQDELHAEARTFDGVKPEESKEYFHAEALKPRAKWRGQKQIRPMDDSVDNPAVLWKFLVEWTSWVRPFTRPEHQDRLFIFVSRREGARGFHCPKTLNAGNDHNWDGVLKRFYKEHDFPHHSYDKYRKTGFDVVDALAGGDIRQIQAAGGHMNEDTTFKSYTTATQVERGDEALGQVSEAKQRWRESGGRIDPRSKPEGADLGAATPGWTCVDPYDGPYAKGKLCAAYGQCPGCHHGSVDLGSDYCCAQTWNLLTATDKAMEDMSPAAWTKRWAPVRKQLREYWLPRFPKEVTERARAMSLPPLPPLE